MKVDLYTKSVLTLIALCLFVLTIQQLDLIPQAKAMPTPKAQSEYAVVPLNPDGSINIRLAPNEVLDVDLVEISTYDDLEVSLVDIETSDELDVNIDEIGGSWVSSGGPIRVEVDD